jgi:diaminopimelate epimerase
MGAPRLARRDIPMTGEPADEPVVGAHLAVSGLDLTVTCVSMGNPHCVLFVDEVAQYPVAEIGPSIENHSAFPKRTNVEFARVVDRGHIDVRVWERGSGETLACGTGASATCVAAALNGLADRQVEIKLLGGELQLEWAENDHVFLTGPATGVFEGEFDPDALLADWRERVGAE